jgi:hypothetical protein
LLNLPFLMILLISIAALARYLARPARSEFVAVAD